MARETAKTSIDANNLWELDRFRRMSMRRHAPAPRCRNYQPLPVAKNDASRWCHILHPPTRPVCCSTNRPTTSTPTASVASNSTRLNTPARVVAVTHDRYVCPRQRRQWILEIDRGKAKPSKATTPRGFWKIEPNGWLFEDTPTKAREKNLAREPPNGFRMSQGSPSQIRKHGSNPTRQLSSRTFEVSTRRVGNPNSLGQTPSAHSSRSRKCQQSRSAEKVLNERHVVSDCARRGSVGIHRPNGAGKTDSCFKNA